MFVYAFADLWTAKTIIFVHIVTAICWRANIARSLSLSHCIGCEFLNTGIWIMWIKLNWFIQSIASETATISMQQDLNKNYVSVNHYITQFYSRCIIIFHHYALLWRSNWLFENEYKLPPSNNAIICKLNGIFHLSYKYEMNAWIIIF